MVRDDGCLILYDTVCQTEISTLFPGYQIPMEDTSDICLCTADDTGVYFTVDERKFMHVKSDGSVEELRGFDEPQTVRLAAVDGSVFYYDKWAEDGRYDTGTPYCLWNGRILFSSGGFLYSVNVDDTGDEKSTEISGNNCTLMGEYIYYVIQETEDCTRLTSPLWKLRRRMIPITHGEELWWQWEIVS